MYVATQQPRMYNTYVHPIQRIYESKVLWYHTSLYMSFFNFTAHLPLHRTVNRGNMHDDALHNNTPSINKTSDTGVVFKQTKHVPPLIKYGRVPSACSLPSQRETTPAETIHKEENIKKKRKYTL